MTVPADAFDWATLVAGQSWAGHSEEWTSRELAGSETDLMEYLHGVLTNPDDTAHYTKGGLRKAIAIDSHNDVVIIMHYDHPELSTAFFSDRMSASAYMQRELTCAEQ